MQVEMWTYSVLVWFQVLVFHELGHWLGYKSFGFKPIVKLKWYGVLIGENCYLDTIPFSAYVINTLGIIFGYLILMIYHSPTNWALVYLIMCSIDIVNVLNIIQIPKKQHHMNLKKIMILQLKELEGDADAAAENKEILPEL